jgi:hypothetical protein
MNYEIVTQRWSCPECGNPVRLHFFRASGPDDEPSDEFILDRVFCGMGHGIPDEMLEEIRPYADLEFTAAMESGSKVAEVWCAPSDADSEDPMRPNENIPPED